MDGQVPRLQTVDEGQPDQVTERKHKAEAVGGDVDGGEDGRLHVQRVQDVGGLEERDEQDRVGDGGVHPVLVGDES